MKLKIENGSIECDALRGMRELRVNGVTYRSVEHDHEAARKADDEPKPGPKLYVGVDMGAHPKPFAFVRDYVLPTADPNKTSRLDWSDGFTRDPREQQAPAPDYRSDAQKVCEPPCNMRFLNPRFQDHPHNASMTRGEHEAYERGYKLSSATLRETLRETEARCAAYAKQLDQDRNSKTDDAHTAGLARADLALQHRHLRDQVAALQKLKASDFANAELLRKENAALGRTIAELRAELEKAWPGHVCNELARLNAENRGLRDEREKLHAQASEARANSSVATAAAHALKVQHEAQAKLQSSHVRLIEQQRNELGILREFQQSVRSCLLRSEVGAVCNEKPTVEAVNAQAPRSIFDNDGNFRKF